MLVTLKPFAVVFVIAFATFLAARPALSGLIDSKTIDRWRNLFLAVTAAGFLIPNFWLMLFAVAAIVLAFSASEPFKPALYPLLLFSLPVADAIVPGFGGINNFLSLTAFNIFAIIILLPQMVAGERFRPAGAGGGLADLAFLGFSLVVMALCFRDTTWTDGIRRAVVYFLSALPPYYAFSRIEWTREKLRLFAAALAIPLAALALIGVAEVAMSWHFYLPAVRHWGIKFAAEYAVRVDMLRAYASVFGPITFGLFLVMGLSFVTALLRPAKAKTLVAAAWAAIAAGLVVTFSRGPWAGAAFALLVYALTSARPMSVLFRLGAVGVAGLAALAVTPFGDGVIDLIPGLGQSEASTIEYRERLFEIGWRVAMRNPVFGSTNYLASMEALRQGQGIIDIVNAYLYVVLNTGLVGLGLFILANLAAMFGLWRAIPAARGLDPEYGAYAQATLAAMAGVGLTLMTTTNVVAQVQEASWMLTGLAVGIARSVAFASVNRKASFVEPAPSDDPPATEAQASEDPGPPPPLPPHLRQYARRR